MGRTALYRDPVEYRPPRAELHLEADALALAMPDGRTRHCKLDRFAAAAVDGYVVEKVLGQPRVRRRFVQMLVIERERDRERAAAGSERLVVITPPDEGAVAPTIVSVPEAPADAAVVSRGEWTALADWLIGGSRLGACSISDLARLAAIATPQFAVLIGEVAAQRALELAIGAGGPLRGGGIELEAALAPLMDAARVSPRAAEALVSALAHAAGQRRRRR